MSTLIKHIRGVATLTSIITVGAAAGPNMPTTLMYELPSSDLSFFGMEFTDTFAAPTVANIVEARLMLQYTTGPNLEAEDLVIEITAPDGQSWLNTGADLGFFGMGTFITGLSSFELNGVYDVSPGEAFFTISVRAAQSGAVLDGQFTASSIEIDIQPAQAADLNKDGVVNGKDLATMLANWGDCPSPCPADLNLSGVVDGADLALLLSVWG